MLDEKLIALITEEVVRQLTANGRVVLPDRSPGQESSADPQNVVGSDRLLEDPLDPEALERMKKRTTARIGVGKAGARLKTQTMLSLRADHARAQDSVFADVDPAFIEKLGLLSIESQAGDRNTHITRPDLGRKICPKGVEALRQHCEMSPDVQIYASDGLSSAAIEANLEKILPVLTEGLQAKGLKVGTPFYMRFGRVAAEDQVAEVLGAKVVCVLIGERPGLATAESMSAYIVYNAYVGIPEAKRTVVSNIHKDGLTAVEAGAYITEVIQQILDRKASGVDLVK
ncbi:MAG: ethanolamine ammonia-lyase subunit EutC [Firmicutes bacterium]|nr:ethanolamine ammonia-lyase subunit EutC [Bacillota bacterium]MBQ6295863.1 ethanolamine ammonia-lyase subunit EutC [Bacillota bacterium]MBR0210073.1 ethanolamine ammonia-lyase subunit EutC [Bacillota bacterium]MBR0517108.1 ethanolamine ammonia-lyase subunit EutC [Bacillota bacterium]